MDQDETPQRSSARTLAIIAIVIALTAPFWEGAVLGAINIHMPMASQLEENASALDRLDRRTAALEQQLGAATAQLGKLQAQLSETAGRANAAADRTTTLAMVELATALRRPNGFELELAALRGTVPANSDLKPMLDQIEPYAVTGVPSAGRLRQEFSRISGRIDSSQRGILPVAWVMRLLPWQHSANATPASPPDLTPQLLNQAGTQLASSDLAGAVATVQSIGGPAQEALADWLEDARARVAADTLLQKLNDQIGIRANQGVVHKKA